MSAKRIKLRKKYLKNFFKQIKISNNFSSLQELADLLSISHSGLKKYSSGQRTLPELLFKKLLELIPQRSRTYFLKNSKYLSEHWWTSAAGKKGIKKLYQKYGHEKFSEWRKISGKNSPIIGKNLKEIKTPDLDEKLAEFIGAYLGDGTLTQYFLRIFIDPRYSFSYLEYLKGLAEELFGITCKIAFVKNKNVAYLEIKSKKVVEFLEKEFQIKCGDKIRNQAKIPEQILSNPKLTIACLRGLMDTDGSVSKRGNQLCLVFTAHNSSLLAQVEIINQNLGLFSHSNSTQVGTNSWPKIKKYFQLVGSSNIAHIIRFQEYSVHKKLLYLAETKAYLKKYSFVRFPYCGPMV